MGQYRRPLPVSGPQLERPWRPGRRSRVPPPEDRQVALEPFYPLTGPVEKGGSWGEARKPPRRREAGEASADRPGASGGATDFETQEEQCWRV